MKTITKYLSIVAILLVTGVVVLYAHAWRPAQGSPQSLDTDGDCLTVNVTSRHQTIPGVWKIVPTGWWFTEQMVGFRLHLIS